MARIDRLRIALAAPIAAGLLGPAVGACGFDASSDGDRHLVRDSAGIRIVESRAPAWTRDRAWTIPGEPAAEIGRVDGPAAHQLHRVVGAVRLDDGTIVVANAGTGELRWFDAAGEHLASAGAEGDGPGEFRMLSWIGRAGGDSIAAWDRRHRRLSVFVAGRFVRDARGELPDDRALPTVHGELADGTLLVGPGPVYIPEEAAGVQRPPMPVWLISPEGGRRGTLGPFPGTSVNLRPAATEGAFIRTEVPFGASTHIAAAGERIVVGDDVAYEIRWYSPGGALTSIVRRTDVSPRPVRQADLDAELERRLAPAPPIEEIRAGIRASFRETPAAETMPYYRDLRVDRVGNLWVRRDVSPTDPSPVWDVFDPDGRWLGRVDSPAGLRITEIGADYVLGIWTDELEVEHVRVYELRKP